MVCKVFVDVVDIRYSVMFLNKYSESTYLSSVADKMADIIIDYETNRDIPVENEDDFEIDDEIITEEEFLRNVDEEMDNEEITKKQTVKNAQTCFVDEDDQGNVQQLPEDKSVDIIQDLETLF